MGGEGAAFRERLGEEGPLPNGITYHAAEALVFDVIRAQGIAVHQQRGHALKFYQRGIGKYPAAGESRKAIADQKIAVAMHEINGHTDRSQFVQASHDPSMMRIRVIISDPGFEEISQDVEAVSPTGFAAQELQEQLRDPRTYRVEMQI